MVNKISLGELKGMCPEGRVSLREEKRIAIYANGNKRTGFLGYNSEDGVVVQVPSCGIFPVRKGTNVELDGKRYEVV